MASEAHRVYPVGVELLRKGPPHNQLLSKITEYIAMCGNLSAVTVRLPFDHRDLENQLESLSYLGQDKARRFVLDDMATATKAILDQIPGVAPALSQAYENRSDITHLRLVLTPHELALVPFETAFVPDGAPGGAGSRLLVQSAAPVTLTREVRGVAGVDIQWPREPRVLLAWASLPNGGDVPFERHVLAMRQALSLWLPPYLARGEGAAPDPAKEQQHNLRHLQRRLTLLPNATIRDIYEACEKTPFTHVHILAHGVPKAEAVGQQSVGVALRSVSGDGIDLVDGARLANALRFQDKEKGQLPAMVVLATCDSGRQRSVIVQGGSIAHELHVAGIPIVIASQFPLSKEGSVVLAAELYRRVLDGEDPRVAMYYVRRKLFSTYEQYHDWASLVMYTCLPRDFDAQLRALQYGLAKRRIESLLNRADKLIFMPPGAAGSGLVDTERVSDDLSEILADLDAAAEELKARGDDTADTVGIVASTKKRKAEALFRASQFPSVTDSTQYAYLQRSLDALAASRDAYRKAMRMNLSSHWVGVQYLSLDVVVNVARGRGQWLDEVAWGAVRFAASDALTSASASDRAYAHASLAELYLLHAITRDTGPSSDDIAAAENEIRQFSDLVAFDSFEAYSTRRQLRRYVDWWSAPLNPKTPGVVLFTYQLPDRLLALL